MTAIIRAFVSMCLLRMTPQQLPASLPLLATVLLVDLVISPFAMQYTYAPALAVMVVIAGLIFLATFLNLALSLKGLRARFVQTLTAIEGTDIVITLVAWPPSQWFYSLKQAGASTLVPALLLFFLMIWNVVIISHILRHALSTSMPAATTLALGYVILSTYIIAALFPAG
jgi:hypothetical protein